MDRSISFEESKYIGGKVSLKLLLICETEMSQVLGYRNVPENLATSCVYAYFTMIFFFLNV